MTNSSKLCELWLHTSIFTEANEGTLISHLVAIIRGGKDCDAFAVMFDNIPCYSNKSKICQKVQRD